MKTLSKDMKTLSKDMKTLSKDMKTYLKKVSLHLREQVFEDSRVPAKTCENSTYAVIPWDKEAHSPVYFPSEACFSALRDYSQEYHGGAEYLLIHIYNQKDNKLNGFKDKYKLQREYPHTVAYYEWLANESAFKDAFITKSGRFMLNNYVLLDCKVDSSILLLAAIATRMHFERPAIPFLTVKFIEAGVNKDLAFLFAHYFSLTSYREMLFRPIMSPNHTVFTHSRDRLLSSFCKAYLDRDLGREPTPYYEILSYSSIHSTWLSGDYRGYYVNVGEVLPLRDTSVGQAIDWAKQAEINVFNAIGRLP